MKCLMPITYLWRWSMRKKDTVDEAPHRVVSAVSSATAAGQLLSFKASKTLQKSPYNPTFAGGFAHTSKVMAGFEMDVLTRSKAATYMWVLQT